MSKRLSKDIKPTIDGGNVQVTIDGRNGMDILMISTATNQRKIEQLVLAGEEINELYELLKKWKGEANE